jgi:hypothetical protein
MAHRSEAAEMDPVFSISSRILNLSGWMFSICTWRNTPPRPTAVMLDEPAPALG